ncbi:GRB2-associated-binding protein 1 isoform X2 [Protopterus annectens]|uniref:GRB2-associated-binding protein 1 isoform X2 n=1 Tax=Protopterus annectens TaxID=7888 RepID=UPI001CFB7F65|nr:GRB2-associated-binding protein 1 isoform X2 [Protopterus annectens]
MSGGDIVYCGWLRKSPPEKKLKRFAWKRRWFILRSGRLTGDPDVLEYYKNDHTKKPIRIIDLNLCEQVDAGLVFEKKEFENSFIFDIKTIDRVFYLVADTEEEMNKWVRHICEICGFNPTDDDAVKSHGTSNHATIEMPLSGNINMSQPSVPSFEALPPPYETVRVGHADSMSSQEESQDYLLLSHCESRVPVPASKERSIASEEGIEYLLLGDFQVKKILFQNQSHAESTKSTSSETDCNDNVPSHRHTAVPTPKHAVNGGFQQHAVYDSPPTRATSISVNSTFYHLPRSYSQDISSKASSPSSPLTDNEGELYVFNTLPGKSTLESPMKQMSLSYDIPSTPGGSYHTSRTSSENQLALSYTKPESLPDIPPPRPPKPSHAPDRSPVEAYSVPRPASDTDSNYCIPTGGLLPSRSNTLSTVDSSRLKKDFGSQDCYDIPRTFAMDRCSSLELGDSFSSYLNKGMVACGSVSSEEADENYVPMNPNSPPRHHSTSLLEHVQEMNYVPMTPSTFDFSSFGMQVPPPAHMGFRSSPKTPPRRTAKTDCEPPPVDRNLKPDRKGQSPKILRTKAHGLKRTDSETIGDFATRRFKVKPAPLEIKPLPEWEEFPAPVRSPVTRSFTRDSSRFPMPTRPPSVHSTASSTDSQDSDENYVAMNPSLSADESHLRLALCTDGGGPSPMSKPRGDKQVEYLDLDLDPGKATPPRKKKSNASGSSAADERVDYVVVDQQKTLALKNTREAWTDERQSTESEIPAKNTK